MKKNLSTYIYIYIYSNHISSVGTWASDSSWLGDPVETLASHSAAVQLPIREK